MKFIDDISLGTRVTILSVIFLVPLVILLFMHITEDERAIYVSNQEIAGVRALVSNHRLLEKYQNYPKGRAASFADASHVTGASPLGDPQATVNRLAETISSVGESASLSLDPQADTYYLIEAVIQTLPTMVSREVELRLLAWQIVDGPAPLDIRSRLGFAAGGLNTAIAAYSDDIARAAAVNGTAGDRLLDSGRRLEMADRGVTLAAASGDGAAIIAASDRLAGAVTAALDTDDAEIARLLTGRVEDYSSELITRLTLVGALVLLGGCFAIVTARAITGPIRSMTEAMARLASGNTGDAELPEGRQDEIGTMARTLRVFREKLVESRWLAQQREDAVDTLSRNEAAFRLPFEANPMPMWVYDQNTLAFLEVNQAAIEEYGWPREAFLRMSVLEVRPEEEREELRAFIRNRTEVRRSSGPWTHLRADGSRFLVQIFSHAMKFGERDAVLVASWDITETKRLEEELLQARKMEAVGQLAAGIAHDFNNLLGGILGFAEFLVADLEAGTQVYRFAEKILTASERARDLVKQILAFSRIHGIDRKPTDIVQIVGETKDLLLASIPDTTQLAIVDSSRSLIADVDATQISQIVLNLGLNANDALQGAAGRITIELSCKAPQPIVHPAAELVDAAEAGFGFSPEQHRIQAGTLWPGRRYARIAVRDTGIGMNAEQMQRMFDPFYTTKPRGRGTGLGLSIVHGIVMGYDGAVGVVSRPGGGSTFAVYIPLSESSVEERPAPPAANDGTERILVIDDEETITEMLGVGLGRFGFQVTTLNDPRDALRVFAEDPDAWDVVISDQLMPGFNGTTLFKKLKAIRPSVRFILCTGFSEDATRGTIRAKGIDGFFQKPVSPKTLAGAIRRLLDPV